MKAHTDPAMILRSVASPEFLRVNRTFVEEMGFSTEDLASRTLSDRIHPDDWPKLEEEVNAGVGVVNARHRTKRGDWALLEWRIRMSEGAPVAGRSPGESAPTAKPDTPVAAAPATTSGESLDAMARIVEAKNPGMRCSILLVDQESGRVTVGAGPSLPSEYNDAVEGLHIGPNIGSCGTAAFWNVPVVVENIAEDPLWSDLREAAALAGVCACWSQPITATHGGVLGAMALYDDEPRAPTQSQMDGLEVAARMVGLAVERDRLEGRLREAAKLEAIGRLAGGVAHDFNNLLTVIVGHVELLLEGSPSADAMPGLRSILHAVDDASVITRQLLAFGRKQVHQPERLDLNELVLDVMHVLDPIVGDDIAASVGLDPSLGWVTIDRTQLRQIMLNLVLNARDAMPGGGQLDIATRHATEQEIARAGASGPPGSFVAITVSDSGQEMDGAALAQAFEPFFSTKETGHGTGLGLASVYGLTRQNGGHVIAESEVGRGTTITLLFPKGEPVPSAVIEEDTDTKPSIATVLVAEDNDEIRELATRILTEANLSVHQARNGVEALSLCEDGLVVDLLVADVAMPSMGGVELAGRLRQLLPDARTIYVSAHPFDRLHLPDLEPTRASYLAKPFTPAELRNEVHRVLSIDKGAGAFSVQA